MAQESRRMTKKNQPSSSVSRRTFIGTAATAAGITILPRHVLGAGFQAPSDTVNVAVIGFAHGMGTSNLMNVAKSDNIVALCDCDASDAAKAAMAKNGISEKFPKAILHQDFRKMFETQKDIDAVVVATPDHNHAVIAMAAMQLGKHVYVQKPLTRTVSEARALTDAARKYKLVSQMGNQGHSEEGLRLMQEWVAAGAIGPIREVHCWTNRRASLGRPTRRPCPRDWTGICGSAPPRRARTARSTIRLPGARTRISAPARWATWVVT
jgi:Oxidoreductase family, NAD-binding Rossmann fold